MNLFGLSMGPKPSPDETHHVTTSDGWRLALHRYRSPDRSIVGEPVLLHHGLGANAAQFDLGVGGPGGAVPSLARWLADRGYDVWACDLRGSGKSERPGEFELSRWNWSVDDFIEKDDPAFVDYILSHSSYDKLHWVGHSLGGILMMCYCIKHGNDKLASGVAAAAGLDFSGSNSSYRFIVPLSKLGRFVRRVPSGTAAKFLAPLAGRTQSGLESWGYHPPNIAPAAARAIYSGVNHDVPGELLHQLTTLFTDGGICSADHNFCYSDYSSDIEIPILMMAGNRDLQFTAEAATKSFKLLDGKRDKLIRFGKEYGQSADYGHFDLLAGKCSDHEVFPSILGWLKKHSMNKTEDKSNTVKLPRRSGGREAARVAAM